MTDMPEVVWPATDDPIPPSPMRQVFDEVWFTHKFAHYIPIYEEVLSRYRDRPVRMLEIGVARGGSLRMWRQYLHPDSTVVGIDADPRCKTADDAAAGIHVRIGDQADEAFLALVAQEFGPFDIVLDDGSHLPEPTRRSFRWLFPHGLCDGGVYMVEDLFSCYMPGANQPPTFMDDVKDLLDVMHAHYSRVEPPMSDALQVNSPLRAKSVTVPWATTMIGSVDVRDGIVIIRREPHPLPRILMRTEPW